MSTRNPFFDISLLPYQAPRFDEINDSHYRPAFDEAIRQKRADIDAIVAQTAAPDFDNTVLALEKSGAMLARVSSIFFAMTSAHTNARLQELEEQSQPSWPRWPMISGSTTRYFPAWRASGRIVRRWMLSPADWLK